MTEPERPQQFVGTWALRAVRLVHGDGRASQPFGTEPLGYLTYTADGFMHAIFMHADPAKADRGTSYSATWEVRGPEVVHHVTAALVREWIGTELPRTYAFDGDGMTLTAHEPDRTFELAWQKLGAAR